MELSRTRIAAILGCALLVSHMAHADVTLDSEYMQRLQIHQTIAPQGATPFGEQINPYTGSLSFRQTDVTFEGIGPAIQLVRGPIASASAEAAQTQSRLSGAGACRYRGSKRLSICWAG